MIRSPLAQKVVLGVFLGIVTIEIIILIPSYHNREAELVEQTRLHISHVTESFLNQQRIPFDEKLALIQGLPEVRTIRLIESDQAAPSHSRYLKGQGELLIYQRVSDIRSSVLEIVADVSFVRQQLTDYVLRIIGLIILISAFVTLVTMLILGYLMINPIIDLTRSIRKVRTESDFRPVSPSIRKRMDELGDLGRSYELLTENISKVFNDVELMARFPEENPNPILRCTFDGRIIYRNSSASREAFFFESPDQQYLTQRLLPSVAETMNSGKSANIDLSDETKTFSIAIVVLKKHGYFNIYARDITAKVQAEKALREIKDHLETLVRQRTHELEEREVQLIIAKEEAEAAKEAAEQAKEVAEEARRTAEKADQAKTAFLATISHELRTPMHGAMGLLSLMEDTDLDEEQKDLMGSVKVSGSNLLNIVNDILDYTSLEAGHLTLNESDFALQELAFNATETVRPEADLKGLALSYHLKTESDEIYCGDAGRILQIMIKLLDNAIKFTGEGEVILTIRADQPLEHQSLHRVLFEIEDTGPGIAEEQQPLLFKRFSQLDSSMSRQFGGTGLGLVICKSLTDLLGGEIGMRQRASGGSLFWFELVLKRDFAE